MIYASIMLHIMIARKVTAPATPANELDEMTTSKSEANASSGSQRGQKVVVDVVLQENVNLFA